jgi:hypothetical protein
MGFCKLLWRHLIHSSLQGGDGNLPAGSTKAWPIDGNINRLSGW